MTESALATHAARRAVMSLLLSWPVAIPCTLATVGGADALLSLAKVVAASENVFSTLGTESGDRTSSAVSPLMDLVKNRLKGFLQLERGASAAPRGVKTLSSALVGDCTTNVENSTQPGDVSEVITSESLHPHFPKCDYHGEVAFEGAKALSVSFHPMSGVSSGSLSILRGKGGSTLAEFSSTDSFRSIVVHGDRLHFRFHADSDGSVVGWGYSFDVSPMRGLQWLNEREALADPSLMWACWLLRYLLDEVKDLVQPGAVRSRAVFDALIRYITTSGAPFKHQIVSLLSQLLTNPELLPRGAGGPDYGKFAVLERVVLQRIDAERASGDVFLPWKLQQLAEMCAMARYARRCVEEPRFPRVPFDPARDMTRPKLSFLSNAKLVQPVARPPALNIVGCSDLDAMVDVMDMADSLVGNIRLADRFTVAIAAMAAGLPPEDPKVLVRFSAAVFVPLLKCAGRF